MGLNRSWPLPYAESAQKVLDAAPEWVLAEHGGPFEFNAEDFRRRVQWGKVSAKAADVLCVSGDHRVDWDPHRVHVEPLIHKAKAGATLKAKLVATNPTARRQKLSVTLECRGLLTDVSFPLAPTADPAYDLYPRSGKTLSVDVTLRLSEKIAAGRHIFALRVMEGDRTDGSDAFLAVDVER
jgi:hypothetical protein